MQRRKEAEFWDRLFSPQGTWTSASLQLDSYLRRKRLDCQRPHPYSATDLKVWISNPRRQVTHILFSKKSGPETRCEEDFKADRGQRIGFIQRVLSRPDVILFQHPNVYHYISQTREGEHFQVIVHSRDTESGQVLDLKTAYPIFADHSDHMAVLTELILVCQETYPWN